jgi:hypothetical protein
MAAPRPFCCTDNRACGRPSPIPVVVEGFASKIATASFVSKELFSQTSETSSSVAAIPVGLLVDSENGMKPALERRVTAEVPSIV